VTTLRRSVLVLDDPSPSWPPPHVNAVPDAVLLSPRSVGGDVVEQIVQDCHRYDTAIVLDITPEDAETWHMLRPDSVVARIESIEMASALERTLDDLAARCGLELGIELLIDMPLSARRLREIARACGGRLRSILADPERLATSLGVRLSEKVDVLAFARGNVVLAAAEHRVPGVGRFPAAGHHWAAAADPDAVAFSFAMGLHGGLCRTWDDVTTCNTGFAPDAVMEKRASRVLDAMEEAMRAGRGAISLDGRMIDIPFVALFERRLALVDRVEERRSHLRSAGGWHA